MPRVIGWLDCLPVSRTRGEGQGMGGPRQGDGGPAQCVCPKCGKKYAHERGKPCTAQKCPECGVALVGLDAALVNWYNRMPPVSKGGPGSGNFGHAGRPGQKGGSAPSKQPWWMRPRRGRWNQPPPDITPPAPKGWQKRGSGHGAVYIRDKRDDPNKSVQILCEPEGGRGGAPVVKVGLWLFGKRWGSPGLPYEALYEYEGMKLEPALALCDHFIRTGEFPESEFAKKIDEVPE